VALVYLALTLITTWPLVRYLGTAVPGWAGDQTQFMWAWDTFWTELVHGRSPFATDRVFFPLGAVIVAGEGNQTVAALSFPFWLLGGGHGLVWWFGLLTLTVPVAVGLAMRAVVRALTSDDEAAFWAGLLFAFSPTYLAVLGSPFVPLDGVAALWTILALLAVVVLARAPSMRVMAALSVLVWVQAFTYPYAAVQVVLLVGLLIPITWRREYVSLVPRAALANLALALVLVCFVFPPIPTDYSIGGDGIWSKAHINLANLFIPGAHLPVMFPGQVVGGVPGTGVLWNGVLGRWADRALDGGPDPGSYYLGVGVLMLAVLGLVRARPRRIMLGLAAVAVLLVLCAGGTRLLWGTHVLATGWSTPWRWLVAVPHLELMDRARPFVVGAVVPLTALAGVGVAMLPRAWWRTALVGGIWFVECCRIGIPLYVPPEPLVYRALATMPQVRTVLELPMGLAESKGSWGLGRYSNPAMWWQTLHRKDRTAGYLARIPHHTVSRVLQTPVLGDLIVRTHRGRPVVDFDGQRHEEVPHIPRYDPAAIDRFLCDLKIDAIVLALDRDPELEGEVRGMLDARVIREVRAEGWTLLLVTARCG
jgi:hypothetical protein